MDNILIRYPNQRYCLFCGMNVRTVNKHTVNLFLKSMGILFLYRRDLHPQRQDVSTLENLAASEIPENVSRRHVIKFRICIIFSGIILTWHKSLQLWIITTIKHECSPAAHAIPRSTSTLVTDGGTRCCSLILSQNSGTFCYKCGWSSFLWDQ